MLYFVLPGVIVVISQYLRKNKQNKVIGYQGIYYINLKRKKV